MDNSLAHDNTIEWIFEKIYDQLTLESAELYLQPFINIKNLIFSENIYNVIADLTRKEPDLISKYLNNEYFIKKFLFSKIKKRIYVAILLNNLSDIQYLISQGYSADYKCLELSILNNRMDLLNYFIEAIKIPVKNELLMICAEHGYTEIYFCLRKFGLVPNISIYKKAVSGPSLDIVKDVATIISINNTILETAFPNNHTEILLFLIGEALNDKMKISSKFAVYPILNSNMVLLNFLQDNNLFEWNDEFYYSAILSGSMEMIQYLEKFCPDIHDNHKLDTSKTKRGRNSLLLEDMIYEVNNKKYFSHCMNYAIQSESLEIVKYIHKLGYGISVSNIITAIKQAPCDILEYILQNYQGILPEYLIHYFGIYSHIADKISKAAILSKYNIFAYTSDIDIKNAQKESVHLEMITSGNEVPENALTDIDYLMKYRLFFNNTRQIQNLLCKVKINLQIGNMTELNIICDNTQDKITKQVLVDALFLFGDIDQIKILCPKIQNIVVPNHLIILEIMCYNQINKLCYLLQNKLLTSEIIKLLYPVKTMLANKYIDAIFDKIDTTTIPNPKYIIYSNDTNRITAYSKNINTSLNKSLVIEIIKLDNIDILKNFSIDKNLVPEIIEWCQNNDFLEVVTYLNQLSLP